VPADCNSQDAYKGLIDYINNLIKEMEVGPFKLNVYLPYVNDDHPLSSGAIITIVLTAFIAFFGIVGIFVEYLPILEKPHSLPTMKLEERKTKLGLLFFSFSFKNNLQKLFEVSDRGDSNLKILNGIRVFSICWVVIGHAFMNVLGAPLTNMMTALDVTKDWYFTLVPGGFFAVDVFFFLSGFLTFYLLTIKIYPRKGRENYLMVYFHRWFRLFTPALY